MSVNKISPVYNYNGKTNGQTLDATEWNSLSQATHDTVVKVNEVIDNLGNGGGTVIDSSGKISVSNKGNLTIGNNSIKNINLEPGYPYSLDNTKYGDISLKPGDDILFFSHHREAKKRDKIVLKSLDGSDNPVKTLIVTGELEIALGTEDNPKTATRQKDSTTGADISETPLFKTEDSKTLDIRIITGLILDKNTNNKRDERANLKVRAKAIDLRCEDHGGIALQPKGEDSDHHMNKIKFEHGGGDGLEFGTFNAEKTSIFTDEYRFNKDGVWKMATRTKLVSSKYDNKDETTHYKYVKADDDFYDNINRFDKTATTEQIIKTADAFNCFGMRTTCLKNSETNTPAIINITSVDEWTIKYTLSQEENTSWNNAGSTEITLSGSGSLIDLRSILKDGRSYDYEDLANLIENEAYNYASANNTMYSYSYFYTRFLAVKDTKDIIKISTNSSAYKFERGTIPSNIENIDAYYYASNSYNFENGGLYTGNDFVTYTDSDDPTIPNHFIILDDTNNEPIEYWEVSSTPQQQATNVYIVCTRMTPPDINIDGGDTVKLHSTRSTILSSDKNVVLSPTEKIKFNGKLDFGDTFDFGETKDGIQTQRKLTSAGNTKPCDTIRVVGVNNHTSNNLTVDGWDSQNNAITTYTIAPGNTQTLAECSLLDVILLTNYMKTHQEGPWAAQL